jgi:hypothetical protein
LIALLATLVSAAVLATVSATPGSAATSERVVTDRLSGLAIRGFDPVAYFTDGEPKLGLPEYELSQGGVVWQFSNEANRAFFSARPDIYAPQFGGYDPVAVTRGVAFAGNALVWLVLGQRLYLFGDEASRDAFAADPERVLRDARRRWPALQETLAQ